MWRSGWIPVLIVLAGGESRGGHGAYGIHGAGVHDFGQPTQQLARATATGEIELNVLAVKPVHKEQTFEYTVNVPFQTPEGKTETRQESRTGIRKVTAWVSEQRIETLTPHTQYFEIDGRPLDRKAAATRLSYPNLVLVSSDGKMVPNYYTWLFQAGTLVVVPGNGPPPYVGPREETATPAFQYPGNGPPPLLRFASLDARGTVRLRQFIEKQEHQTASAPRADGYTEIPLRQIMHRTQITQVALAHVKVFRGSGNRLDSQGLRGLLPREMTVLVSADGQPLHPFWLRNIKPSALILAHPVPVAKPAFEYPRPQEHPTAPVAPPPAST